ncbi:unnamed protein product [Closterium sp. NIES-64]|nr:unnamed protein product [Closterium sp. NIES-64]
MSDQCGHLQKGLTLLLPLATSKASPLAGTTPAATTAATSTPTAATTAASPAPAAAAPPTRGRRSSYLLSKKIVNSCSRGD